MEVAIIAGGCFWCTEAIFKRLIGVEQVEVGFVGGSVPEPSYKEVCKGDTGHAEAIRPMTLSNSLTWIYWRSSGKHMILPPLTDKGRMRGLNTAQLFSTLMKISTKQPYKARSE